MAQVSGSQGTGAWSKLRSWPLFGIAISLVIVLLGSLLASWIQSGAGAAQVTEVTYVGTGNGINDAYLFIPNGVTAQNPAPAVLAVHGYNDSKEYMVNTALELARRGFVVLDIDMEGHGHSDLVVPGDTANGAIDGVNLLRSLAIVDKTRIGGVGMSDGGVAIDIAANAQPGTFKSLFFMDAPCSLACTASIDEALSVATGTEWPVWTGLNDPSPTTGAGIKDAPAVEKWAGTTGPVVPGQVYGSVQAGTARVLYEHWGDHPLSTDDPTTIGNVISWFNLTLGGDTVSGQIWPLKDLGTGITFVGLVLFMFALGAWLLRSKRFESLNEAPPAYNGASGRTWWVFAVITALLGPVLFLWAFMTGAGTNASFGTYSLEPVATGFAFWFAAVGLITIVILAISHYALGRKRGASLLSYGLTWEGLGIDWRKVGKSVLFALLVMGPAYFILWVADSALHVDARFWLVTLKTSDLQHFPLAILYAIPIALYFVAISVVLNGTLRPKNGQATLRREFLTNTLVLWLGAALFVAWIYVPLEFLGAAPTNDPTYWFYMGTINFMPLLVLLPVVVGFITYFFRKTGHVYLGAALCTIFVTWYIVAAETINTW